MHLSIYALAMSALVGSIQATTTCFSGNGETWVVAQPRDCAYVGMVPRAEEGTGYECYKWDSDNRVTDTVYVAKGYMCPENYRAKNLYANIH